MAAAALSSSLRIYGVSSLKETIDLLNEPDRFAPTSINLDDYLTSRATYSVDFADIKGQQDAKLAMEIAAAGGHNIIMIGPPGSGKTMLAKALPSILPPMLFEEALETTKNLFCRWTFTTGRCTSHTASLSQSTSYQQQCGSHRWRQSS